MNSQELLKTNDYREFLHQWIYCQDAKGKKINFSALSRKAGLSSRSFIKEVLEGKKSLTNVSLPKFIRAFDLKGDEAKYFQYLVASQEPTIDLGFKSPAEVTVKLQKIREKWLRKSNPLLEQENKNALARWAFKIHHVGEVYAALGNSKSGASLADVKLRTELSEQICQEVLNFLLDNGAAALQKNRYFARRMSFDIFNLGSDESFKSQYQGALLQLQRKSRASFKSAEEFYFHSAFSVKKAKLPEFKERLKELVTEFLDEAQDDNGDKIGKLTLGLHL
jgi:uncharacterized protein (TIGR02147 family)